MSYDPTAVDKLLEAIATKLDPHLKKVLAISTDVLGASKGKPTPSVTLFRANGGKSIHIHVDGSPTEAARRLVINASSMSMETAMEIVEAARGLYALNDRGSWCVLPDETVPVAELTPDTLIDSGYLDRSYDRLAKLLPSVDVIYTDVGLKAAGDGRMRPRHWLSFEDADDKELASIDAASLPSHIALALTGRGDEHAQSNHSRLNRWAEQLSIDVDDIGEVLDLVRLMGITGGYGLIRLR